MNPVRDLMVTATVCTLMVCGVRGGALDPTDPPGPTMHTLEELYQRVLAQEQQLAELEQRLEAAGIGVGVAPSGMVLIPSGSFVMGATTNAGHDEANGDELPQHTVRVSAFYIDRYEVTKDQWNIVYDWATEHGYAFSSGCGLGKGDTHPVQTVSWFDGVKWCNARSEMAGLAACYTVSGEVYRAGEFLPECDFRLGGYRLPTETEWEKAARGGVSNRRFPWSDTSTIQHGRANYLANNTYSYDTSPTEGYHPDYDEAPMPYTSPAGTFAPNGYGLYDMAGNVWEWCWDWYDEYAYDTASSDDPTGPGWGSQRVSRGGSYGDVAANNRVSNREKSEPVNALYYQGMRTVRSAGVR